MSVRLLMLAASTYASVVLPAAILGDAQNAVGCAHDVKSRKDERDECAALASAPVLINEEYALGGAVAVRLVGPNGLLLDDPSSNTAPRTKLARFLDVVGKNLGAQSARPIFPWTFAILDDHAEPAVNAFSTPGGYVFVSRTLLKHVDNEAQLAAVLAHEIAHVTQQHAIKTYQTVKVDTCNYAFGADIGLTALKTAVHNLVSGGPGAVLNLDDGANAELLADLTERLVSSVAKGLPHEMEFEADRIGAELLITAGYDPHEMVAYVHRLGSGAGGMLKNHPAPAEREAQLKAWLAQYCHPPDGVAPTLLASDCPFTDYPAVPLPADIQAAIAAL